VKSKLRIRNQKLKTGSYLVNQDSSSSLDNL
jgi:hypothetical protein